MNASAACGGNLSERPCLCEVMSCLSFLINPLRLWQPSPGQPAASLTAQPPRHSSATAGGLLSLLTDPRCEWNGCARQSRIKGQEIPYSRSLYKRPCKRVLLPCLIQSNLPPQFSGMWLIRGLTQSGLSSSPPAPSPPSLGSPLSLDGRPMAQPLRLSSRPHLPSRCIQPPGTCTGASRGPTSSGS